MKRIVILSMMLFCISCAKVEIKKVASAGEDGIHFHQSHPYLLVTVSSDRTNRYQIIYLPKKNEEFVARIREGLGTVDIKIELEDGWRLTKFGEVSSQSSPTDMINTLNQMGMVGKTRNFSMVYEPQSSRELDSGLYLIEFDNDGFVKGMRLVISFNK